MSHDYSEQSTTEDPQMLAFFDSLIQRARDGSASDSNDMSSDENILCNSNSDLVDAHYSSLSDDYRKCTEFFSRRKTYPKSQFGAKLGEKNMVNREPREKC